MIRYRLDVYVSQFQLPCFSHQVVSEAVVVFLANELIAGLFVNVPSSMENIVSPEYDAPIAGRLGESCAFIYKSSADP